VASGDEEMVKTVPITSRKTVVKLVEIIAVNLNLCNNCFFITTLFNMKFNFEKEKLSGDLSATKLFLVKYFDQYAPENSGYYLTVANDELHLKRLEKEKLKIFFEKEEWFSADAESAELGEFEKQFENDWGNWIKFYEIGNSN